MQDANAAFQNAARQVRDAARRLDDAMTEAATTQAKHDDTVRRLVDLIKARDAKWDATARAALSALSGKQAVLQRRLRSLRATIDQSRSAYEAEARAFAEVSDFYTERLIMDRRQTRVARRREAALGHALDETIDNMWQRREQAGPDAADFTMPDTSFGYIPLELPRFLNLLLHLSETLALDPDYAARGGRYRPVSFLEVGCGQGRNLLIARNSKLLKLGRIAGFDLNAEMVAGGNAALGLDDALFVQDALDYDYGEFDIVFSYRPLSYNPLQQQLEAQMARTMRKGAYLLAPYPFDLTLYPEMTKISEDIEIWKKTGAGVE